jgi:protein-disulfide isomerase
MQEQKQNSFIPAAILLAGFLIAMSIYFTNKDKNVVAEDPNIIPEVSINMKAVSEEDHVLGNPEAPIVIVEFSDTECPYCKIFQTTMNSIIDSYGKEGKVAWVYRHFPLDMLHSKARKESEATECVNELGGNTAFWKMLDTIYARTPGNDGLDLSKLSEFAKEAGVDVDDFNSCLASGRYAGLVESHFQDGVKAGARGTPYNILLLKDTLSISKESELNTYIMKNGLTENIMVYSSGKEISLNGALPFGIMQAVFDIILK